MKLTIDFQHDEKCYSGTVEYSPGRKGVHTLRNGDPGYPDDPPEFYFLTLFEIGDDGVERNAIHLLDDGKVQQEIEDSASESATEAYAEYQHLAADAYWDNKREERLLGEQE